MSGVALGLANVALGLTNIGAGIGFTVAEQDKMDDLNKKSDKLKTDATEVGDLYDHVYYLVAVNLDRVSKAIDKLPSDMIATVQEQIENDVKDSSFESAMKVIASILGYTGGAVGVLASLVQIAAKLRENKASGQEPEPTEEPASESTFDDVPGASEATVPVETTESSMTETPRLTKLSNGLNIAGIVFGVAGLAATVGLGIWTLEKLDDAIDDVNAKQKQVDAFKTALESTLNEVVTAAGLEEKDYDALPALAETWKNISENFDSYEKSMYYAIKGYFSKKSEEEIKAKVDSESDEGKPFPDDGYPLAKTLADDIQYVFDQGKTDKEVVTFFATENPKIGLRFVFDEFFISSLRW